MHNPLENADYVVIGTIILWMVLAIAIAFTVNKIGNAIDRCITRKANRK